MIQRKPCAALAAALLSAVAFASHAFADTMTMWVRASGTNAAAHLVDLWNETHKDKIELTTIPDNQMVTKLATGVQAGEVPDLVSFDLIYMPDFMKAGFLVDLTDDLKADPNYASVARAYKDIATYEGKLYGAGFTPDVSVLVWNKDLFKRAGLDPEKPPQTIGEIDEDAKKIRALGPDVYGFYFSGACPGCNIFASSPMMVAAGSKMLPANDNDEALTGDGTAKALGIGYVPWVYHFADMVNSDSSPWINMYQRTIFDGDVDGAIKEAKEKMKEIAGE